MTELQGALGLSQLKRLSQFVKSRQSIALYYDHELSELPIKTPWQHPDTNSSYHLYPIQVDHLSCNKSQKDLYQSLHKAGIIVNLHYIPVYRQPYYESMGFNQGYCPNAEEYFKSSISIPIYASMSRDQQKRVVKEIRNVLQ